MAETELGPGTSLGEEGRYRLRSLLGAGGMASVWLAEDRRMGRPVAVKVLAEQLCHDPAYRQRLVREAQVSAGLSHPHLVGVFDFSPGPPRPYLVMEYVPGGTLADRLRTGAPLDVEALVRDLLSALARVHAGGIVHRDVKPANVLVDPGGRPKLTDFGIARPSEATGLTATGMVVGTKRYIAPEVLAGAPADFRSDLYSLGILLGECLGERPPRHLRRLAEQLSAEDPARRPPSARAALAVLDKRAASRQVAGGARRRASPLQRRASPVQRRASPVQRRASPVQRRASPVQRHTSPVRRYATRLRRGPQTPIHLTRQAGLLLTVALVLLLALALALAGGGGPATPQRPAAAPAVPPAGAPLTTQLNALRDDVARARRP